jgi:hypothetical protein
VTEPRKLSVTQVISGWTLRESDKRPSELMRRFEADLIGRLAYNAAIEGLQFDGWPTVRLAGDVDYLRNTWHLTASVVAK